MVLIGKFYLVLIFRRLNLNSIYYKPIYSKPDMLLTVKDDLTSSDEDVIRIKELSILELGTLLKQSGRASGKLITFIIITLSSL